MPPRLTLHLPSLYNMPDLAQQNRRYLLLSQGAPWGLLRGRLAPASDDAFEAFACLGDLRVDDWGRLHE